MALTLLSQPRLRLAMLCLLYVAQGLPFGFVTVALAAHLAAGGADAAAVGGVIAMAVLPWSFKWAWGPVVDSGRFASLGRRRPWIMIAQTLMILTAALIAWVPAGNIALLGWMVLVHNVFVGLQDVAVDALAIDMLEGRDRERATGMMFGSSYFGTFLGGAGLGIVAARHGVATAVTVMACVQAVVLMLVTAIRERPGDRWLPWLGPPRAADASGAASTQPLGLVDMARSLLRGMTRRDAALAAAAAVGVKLLPASLEVLMMVHLIDRLGWSQERYSTVTGGGGILMGLLASIAGGYVSGRIGPRTTAIVSNTLLGIAWLVFAAAARYWDHPNVIVAWVAAGTICQAVTTVSLFAIFMRVASPAVAATQFTASMALMNLATSLGSWLAGPIGVFVDAPTAFLLAGLVQPLAGLIVPRVHAAPSLQSSLQKE